MMMLRQGLSRLWIAALALLALCGAASAQVPVKPCIDTVNASLGTHDCLPVTGTNPLAVAAGGAAGAAGYPIGATTWNVAGSGTTAGAAATQAAVAGKFNYICGFLIDPGSATAAITLSYGTSGLPANISGHVGAPVTAAGTTGTQIPVSISPCQPASAANAGITVSIGALGAGGVNQTVSAWGFTQ